MTEEKRKLWFSQKQADDIAKNDPNKELTFGTLEDGSVVEYTDATFIGSDSSPGWDDAIMLGIGTFHHFQKRS